MRRAWALLVTSAAEHADDQVVYGGHKAGCAAGADKAGIFAVCRVTAVVFLAAGPLPKPVACLGAKPGAPADSLSRQRGRAVGWEK